MEFNALLLLGLLNLRIKDPLEKSRSDQAYH